MKEWTCWLCLLVVTDVLVLRAVLAIHQNVYMDSDAYCNTSYRLQDVSDSITVIGQSNFTVGPMNMYKCVTYFVVENNGNLQVHFDSFNINKTNCDVKLYIFDGLTNDAGRRYFITMRYMCNTTDDQRVLEDFKGSQSGLTIMWDRDRLDSQNWNWNITLTPFGLLTRKSVDSTTHLTLRSPGGPTQGFSSAHREQFGFLVMTLLLLGSASLL